MIRFSREMVLWVRHGFLFGGLGMVASLLALVIQAGQSSCGSGAVVTLFFMAPLLLAACAGFATALFKGHLHEGAMAGLATAAVSTLAVPLFIALLVAGHLPESCAEGLRGLGIFLLGVLGIFFAPLAVGAGTAAGWLGALAFRVSLRMAGRPW